VTDFLDHFFGQRVGRDDAGAVARVDSRLFNMFHDRPDDRVLTVSHAVDIDLRGVFQEAIEEDGATRGHLGALLQISADLLLGINDPHRPPAQNKGRTQEKGETDLLGGGQGLLGGGGGSVGRLAEAQLVEHGREEFSVLRPFDGFHRGAKDADSRGLEFGGQIQGGLTPKLNNDSAN